jgi:micrococcal nuclease
MVRPLLLTSLCLTLLTGCAERRASQPPPAPAPVPAAEAEARPAPKDGAATRAPRRERVYSTVTLDGEETRVEWSDGDTFRIRSGPHNDVNARLQGYNTLEDYGPVHRWGAWTPAELFQNAKEAGDFVRARSWTCQSVGEKDRYGRLLVKCDDAGLALVREGLAFIFSVDGPAPDVWQKAQAEGRAGKKGMWQKGVPEELISSVHSASEGRAYNRVVDTRTGHAQTRPHNATYQVCQEVCTGAGPNASCMIYVPFERRYKDRPECLQ